MGGVMIIIMAMMAAFAWFSEYNLSFIFGLL